MKVVTSLEYITALRSAYAAYKFYVNAHDNELGSLTRHEVLTKAWDAEAHLMKIEANLECDPWYYDE